jgi:DNA polymerase-3 subunit epsilon
MSAMFAVPGAGKPLAAPVLSPAREPSPERGGSRLSEGLRMSKPFTTLLLTRPLVVLDLETTGTTPKTDRIVEVAAVKFMPGGERTRCHKRLNPGIPIPPAATAIHGIRDEDVVGCPPFEAVAVSLARYLRDADLAGFNLKRFDLLFLLGEFERAGIAFSLANRAVIDVMQLYHQREPRDLTAAVRHFLSRDHEESHRALADAYATAAVLDAMVVHYGDLPRTVAELHASLTDADLGGRLRREDGRLVLSFGKYAGLTLDKVAAVDIPYLRWLLEQPCLPDFRAFVEKALQHA